MTLSDILDTALLYMAAAADMADWMASPRLIVVWGAALVFNILVRLFGFGAVASAVRGAIYAGLYWLVLRSPDFTTIYGLPPASEGKVVAGVIVGLFAWFPVLLVAGLVEVLVFRRPVRAVDPELASAERGSGPAKPPPKAAGKADKADKGGEHREILTIMLTDIYGYSKRMEKDEAATYELLKEHNAIMRKAIAANNGKEIKTIGDAFLVTYKNPVDALKCGIAMQKGLTEYNKTRPVHDQIKIRIGIHTGEVIVTPKDVFGEGVNIAARLEPLTEPGSISISADVLEGVKNKLTCGFLSLGVKPMKNIANPPEVFKVYFAEEDVAG